MKECQYCSDEAFYVVKIDWEHSYDVQSKSGAIRTVVVPQVHRLHLCTYHYDRRKNP